MNFWRKCGKLITDGSNLIRCDYNPCGYYGLFAFVTRNYDGSTGEVNYCAQPDLEVLPYNVLQGSINYQGRCIKISQQKDSKGRVGYYKGCLDSYQQCVRWNDQWTQCLQWETYYIECCQIEVYRLGGCYDDYNQFAGHVYSKCPQITAPYPDIFQGDWISDTAYNCISKNRDPNNDDSWYSYAYWRYIPKVKLKVDNLNLGLRIQMNTERWQYQWVTFKWCDGECLQWDDNTGDCIDCNGTIYEDAYINSQNMIGYQHGLYRGLQLSDPVILQVPIDGIDGYIQGCEEVDTFNSASLAASRQLLARAAEYPTDRNNYNHSYQESVIICKSGSYQSWAAPGGCWDGGNAYNEYKQAFYARDLYFEKPDKMQGDAIGAVIKLKVIIAKGTANNCSCHSKEDGEQITQQELNVFWGQKIQLPIAHNMENGMKATEGYCNSNDDFQLVSYQPTDGDRGCCGYPCKISWSVEVKRLIFN